MELKEVRIGELDQYLFGQGTHYDIYKKLGAHLATNEGKKGVYFAVWAPHAELVLLVSFITGMAEDIRCQRCRTQVCSKYLSRK